MGKHHLSRRFKHGSSSVLFTVLCLIVIILLYLTCELLTERFGLSLDLTEGGIYEVSEQTEEYLKTLDEKITLTVLADQKDYQTLQGYAQIDALIRKYVQLSGGQIDVRYVNVYKNPSFLQNYPTVQSLREGAVIIESEKRYTAYQIDDFYEFTTDQSFDETYISGNVAEQKLTSGIRFVTMECLPQVVFLTGHNEGKLDEYDDIISQSNYQMQTVNLMGEDIPEGTNLVVLNAPQIDFTAAEIDKLDRYLENDASALLYLYSPHYGEHPVLDRFAADWGVRPAQEIVVDSSRAVGDLSYIAPLVIKSDVTKTLENTTNTILMMSLPGHLELLWENKGYRSLVPLLCSSDASYAKRTDGVLDTLEQENTDSTGAFCLGVMSEQHRYNGSEEAVSRVFFYASDTLLSDVFLKTPNLMNRSYASSLLSFLYKQEDTMVFEPKTMESALLVMTGDTATLIFWLLVVALPCATLLTGLVVWARRRYL